MGASRCRTAAGLYYFNSFRRTDWLPIRRVVDPDEESDRGSVSDAASDECYDSTCSEYESGRSSLRSDGHLSETEMEPDEDGFPIIEDEQDLGEEGGYVPTDGLIEPLDAYADFGDVRRRKTAE